MLSEVLVETARSIQILLSVVVVVLMVVPMVTLGAQAAAEAGVLRVQELAVLVLLVREIMVGPMAGTIVGLPETTPLAVVEELLRSAEMVTLSEGHPEMVEPEQHHLSQEHLLHMPVAEVAEII